MSICVSPWQLRIFAKSPDGAVTSTASSDITFDYDHSFGEKFFFSYTVLAQELVARIFAAKCAWLFSENVRWDFAVLNNGNQRVDILPHYGALRGVAMAIELQVTQQLLHHERQQSDSLVHQLLATTKVQLIYKDGCIKSDLELAMLRKENARLLWQMDELVARIEKLASAGDALRAENKGVCHVLA